jgi:hypothetical protein
MFPQTRARTDAQRNSEDAGKLAANGMIKKADQEQSDAKAFGRHICLLPLCLVGGQGAVAGFSAPSSAHIDHSQPCLPARSTDGAK